jgi:hypothetical protein
VKSLERGIRLDLLIAVCALLISSLAMAASWIQSRETARQTEVLEQQLGAQVWPYVGIDFTLDHANTATIGIENDGLGPAVLYNLSATVDGKTESNFIEVLHALLGANLARRKPHGETMGVGLNGRGVGSVLRPGESSSLLQFTSKHFAPQVMFAYQRVNVRLCYCAIVPGKCRQAETAGNAPPQPVTACTVVPNDMLHANLMPTSTSL